MMLYFRVWPTTVIHGRILIRQEAVSGVPGQKFRGGKWVDAFSSSMLGKHTDYASINNHDVE